MYTCEKCSRFGLSYARQYKPEEFFVGSAESKVWIIGLNPKDELPDESERTKKELESYFENELQVHSYFKKFRTVSPKIYKLFGKNDGVGHTDLVKCFANTWPPPNGKSFKARRQIIENCQPYLMAQLEANTPSIIVCNGRDVCDLIKQILPPIETHETFYYSEFKQNRIAIVLTGFLGRIDNFALRRLGKELENLFRQADIIF